MSYIPSWVLRKDCIEEKFSTFSRKNKEYKIELQQIESVKHAIFFYEGTEIVLQQLIFLSISQDKSAKKSNDDLFRTDAIISIFDNGTKTVSRTMKSTVEYCLNLILKECSG